MQTIDLGKLRFQMLGEWSAETFYEANDVIRYGGNLYVYIYAVKQAGNLPTNTARFALMMPGTVTKGIYSPGTAYRIGEAVNFGSGMYRALEDIEAGVAPDQAPARWLKISDSPSYRGEWATGTSYRLGELVTVGGSTYTCLSSHVASPLFATDAARWSVFMSGMRYRGIYTPGAVYQKDDLVSNGMHILAAKRQLTAPASLVEADWDIVVRGADYLPNQLGKDGQYLSTQGGNPKWEPLNLSVLTNQKLLSEIQAAIQSI